MARCHIEKAGSGPGKERFHRLTDKAGERERCQTELRDALENSSSAKILKRFARSD